MDALKGGCGEYGVVVGIFALSSKWLSMQIEHTKNFILIKDHLSNCNSKAKNPL
jgi:hypothetical protein